MPWLLLAACGETVSVTEVEEIEFSDETLNAGIDYVGESYGASWGYVNDDVLPDLFVNRHRNRAAMLINLADGSFEDREFEIDAWQDLPRSDQHGGAFADFDNDGDTDILISVGARNPTQFLINNGEFYEDGIANYAFDRPAWGGRMPMWFDFTNDGFLDFAMGVSGDNALFQLHEQVGTSFARRNFHSQHECTNNNYGHLVDVTNDGNLDWLCVRQEAFPDRIYDYSIGLPFDDQTALMPSVPNVIDSAVADFNGDLLMDFFGVRGRIRLNGAKIVDADMRMIEAQLIDTDDSTTGLTFQTFGDVSFELHTTSRNAAQVFIGANGVNPEFPGPRLPITFTLSPNDPDVVGLPPDFSAFGDRGLFIGYDPATSTWSVFNYSGPGGRTNSAYAYIDSSQQISNLTEENLQALDLPRQPILLIQSSGTFADFTDAAGLYTPISCVSVVAADFDNDMDVDLYLACRDDVVNSSNMILQNNGFGEFYIDRSAGGAGGPIGPGVGLAESVVAADYDVDGFVDVFVTNGLKLYPELVGFGAGGPDKLYRNLGNTNHWIEMDLVGTVSNRDGVGAVVTVTAGGVAQRKEQNGKYHRWSQDDQRMHFGLAENTTADIEIRWPSGNVDLHTAVAADNLYEIIEQTSITTLIVPTSTPPSTCGSVASMPIFDPAVDLGYFVWKDSCGSDNWHVRVTGGTGPGSNSFDGRIVSDMPFDAVMGQGLEPNDVLDTTSTAGVIDYHLEVAPGRMDGIDFTPAAGATVCIGANSNTSTALAGHDRTPISMPFDIETLGPCTNLLPLIVVADATATENDASGLMSFDVTLSTASAATVTVTYTTFDGTAMAGSDYVFESDVLTFLPGELAQTIDIQLIDNDVVESTETFTIELSNPANADISIQSTGEGTILDDEPSACDMPDYDRASEQAVFIWQDCATGQWSMRATAGGSLVTLVGSVESEAPFTSVVPFSIEGNDVLDFTTDPAIIDFELTTNNIGQDGFDFEIAGSTCFILEQPDLPIYVGVQRNLLGSAFDIETLGLCLAFDPRIDMGDATAAENVAGGLLSLPVTLSAISGNTVTVDYSTSDATATAPADYLATSGTVTFAPGESTATIDVQLIDDLFAEGDETFTVTLANPGNGVLGTTVGTGTIDDDEFAVGVSIADAVVAENAAGAVVTLDITLSEPSLFTVMVDYATSDGTATDPDDYLADSGTVTFLVGEVLKQVQIGIVDDALAEGNEEFLVTLSNTVNSVLVDGEATTTITDDEASPCGAPTYDRATENAVFVWKDCGTDQWHTRMTAGGIQTQWVGNATGSAAFTSVVGFSIEANDILDFTTDPAVIDFTLNANLTGQDGFEFEVASTNEVCFDLTAPAAMSIFVGSARIPVGSRFSLSTLGACP